MLAVSNQCFDLIAVKLKNVDGSVVGKYVNIIIGKVNAGLKVCAKIIADWSW